MCLAPRISVPNIPTPPPPEATATGFGRALGLQESQRRSARLGTAAFRIPLVRGQLGAASAVSAGGPVPVTRQIGAQLQ